MQKAVHGNVSNTLKIAKLCLDKLNRRENGAFSQQFTSFPTSKFTVKTLTPIVFLPSLLS